MKRWRLYIVGLVVVGLLIVLLTRLSYSPAKISRAEREREVYASALGGGEFHVAEYTTLGGLSNYDKKDFDNIAQKLPGLKPDTLFDFQEQNKQPLSLWQYLPSTVDDRILSPNDIQLLEEDRFITLSRIGFNLDFNQAFFLWGIVDKIGNEIKTCDGILVLLHKVDDAWVIQNQLVVLHCNSPLDYK
ncbi:MAG: hypothetical protein CNIPEHKO_01868 [Anaerolineales bacterium]|nr:hypothetical protein [Anaerolineales bacterium]